MAKNIRIIPASGSIYFVPNGVTDTNAIQFQLSDTSNNVKIVDGATSKVFAFFDKTNFRTEFSQSINLFSTSSNPPASVGGLYYNTTDGNIYRSNGSGWSSAAGTSGTSGTSGSSGSSGTSGNSGSSGTSGNSGTSGTSGNSGTSGTSGTSGSNGTSGTSVAVSGTNNALAKFTSATTIGNSIVFADTTKVEISGGEDDCFRISSVQPFPSIRATGASNTAGLQIHPTVGFDAAVGNYNGGNLNLVADSVAVAQVSKTNGVLFYVGTTGPIQALGNNTSAFHTFVNSSSANKTWDISLFNDDWILNESNVTSRLKVLAGGGVYADGFFEFSDKRFKTLVKENPIIDGIESITAKSYIKEGKEELGYYAQDFEGVLDSAILKDKDDILSLSYRQVHTAKIASLEKHITELEIRLSELEAKLNK
jgi:hypothetical protein